jgi:hypothetical protein
MAFMNQEKKAAIAAELKKVVPANWKYSLRVRHHSEIVMTISKAPVDLNAYNNDDLPEEQLAELDKIFDAIHAALNLNNHDNSDPMSDYFDVGHYWHVSIGTYEKPFHVLAA